MQQITVMDAISSAEHFHLFMQHADRIKMAGMAQPINVIHSMFLTRQSDGVLVKTPVFYLWKMFLPHHTANAKWAPNTLVTENVTGNNTSIPVISAGTTVDDQGRVNISLANVDLVNTRTVQITLTSSKASYSVASAQVITGAAKDTYNDFGQAERVNIQTLPAASCGVSGKSIRVTLPVEERRHAHPGPAGVSVTSETPNRGSSKSTATAPSAATATVLSGTSDDGIHRLPAGPRAAPPTGSPACPATPRRCTRRRATRRRAGARRARWRRSSPAP